MIRIQHETRLSVRPGDSDWLIRYRSVVAMHFLTGATISLSITDHALSQHSRNRQEWQPQPTIDSQ